LTWQLAGDPHTRSGRQVLQRLLDDLVSGQSGQGPARPDVPDSSDGPESTDLDDPAELQAAVERMIAAVRIPAGTIRMRDGTGDSYGWK
jgi:hypothetical protein